MTEAPYRSSGYCGDGKVRGDEACDGTNLDQRSCTDLGLTAGQLACKTNCSAYDVSGCGAPDTCGNGRVDGVELCEGDDLSGMDCQGLGYGPGELSCLSNCADFDTSRCGPPPGCGDGEIDGDELCDGENFGRLTCEYMDLGAGALRCGAKCDEIMTSGCVAPVDAGVANHDAGMGHDAAFGLDATVSDTTSVRDTAPTRDRRAPQADAAPGSDHWMPLHDASAQHSDVPGQDRANTNTRPVINEVLVNALGTDTQPGNNLFIELWGPAGLSLNGYTLVGINGDGSTYRTIGLDGQHIGNNGYFLIAHPDGDSSIVAQADLTDSRVDLQNGPDSLQLLDNAVVVDALGYGVFVSEVFAGEGSAVAASEPGDSLSRNANHDDSNNNAIDFVAGTPSPTGGSGLNCTHGCTPLNATQCDGDLLQTCVVGVDGCRGWGTSQACPGNQTCQGEQCQGPVCQDRMDCQPGEGCPVGSCQWIGADDCLFDDDCGRDWTCSASLTCMAGQCLVAADCSTGQTCNAEVCEAVSPGSSCQSDSQCGYRQLCLDDTCQSASCNYGDCPVGARCVANWCQRVDEGSPCLSWSDCGYSQLCTNGQCLAQTITRDCNDYMCNQICTPYNIGSERHVCANGHCIDMEDEPCQQDSDCSRWEYCGIPYPRNGETSYCRDNFNYGRPFNVDCPYCTAGYVCDGDSLHCADNGLMYLKCEWVELGSPCQTNESSCGSGRICLSSSGGLEGTCEEWDGVSCPNGSSDCRHSYSCIAGSCVSRVGIPCDYNFECGNGDCCLQSTSSHNYCADAVENERGCL